MRSYLICLCIKAMRSQAAGNGWQHIATMARVCLHSYIQRYIVKS